MKKVLKKAKKASKVVNLLSTREKNKVLLQMADEILKHKSAIVAKNRLDLEHAKELSLSSAMQDRLLLNTQRIKDMATSIKNIAKQKDPVGKELKSWSIQKGLVVKKVSVPIGIISIIYESRPNVTSDTATLCFKSGNGCILKGGKEAINSNKIIVQILQNVLEKNGLPKEIITFIDGSRDEVKKLLKMDKYIDLIIPRGGENLVKFITKNSSIPVIKHDKGLCHLYVDKYADFSHAIKVALNAKCQRTGVCNAIETLLVHEDIAQQFLPKMKKAFDKEGTFLKGCKNTRKIIKVVKADSLDWDREYLANTISIKVVKDVHEAIKHITKHGSLHSESIITKNPKIGKLFLKNIDASCVYLNASTRFTDGGIFGFGAEIGISTNKLHVRGPVGADDLTTYKYKIYGDGHIRD